MLIKPSVCGRSARANTLASVATKQGDSIQKPQISCFNWQHFIIAVSLIYLSSTLPSMKNPLSPLFIGCPIFPMYSSRVFSSNVRVIWQIFRHCDRCCSLDLGKGKSNYQQKRRTSCPRLDGKDHCVWTLLTSVNCQLVFPIMVRW